MNQEGKLYSQVIKHNDGFYYPCTYNDCSYEPKSGELKCDVTKGETCSKDPHHVLHLQNAADIGPKSIFAGNITKNYVLIPKESSKINNVRSFSEAYHYLDTHPSTNRNFLATQLFTGPKNKACVRMDPCPSNVLCCKSMQEPETKVTEKLTRAYTANDKYWRVCTEAEKCTGKVCTKEPEVCHKDQPMYEVRNRNAKLLAPSTSINDRLYIPKEMLDMGRTHIVPLLSYADTRPNVSFGNVAAWSTPAASNVCVRTTPCLEEITTKGFGLNNVACCPNAAVPPLFNGVEQYPSVLPQYDVPIITNANDIDRQYVFKDLPPAATHVLLTQIDQLQHTTKHHMNADLPYPRSVDDIDRETSVQNALVRKQYDAVMQELTTKQQQLEANADTYRNKQIMTYSVIALITVIGLIISAVVFQFLGPLGGFIATISTTALLFLTWFLVKKYYLDKQK